MMTKTTRLVPSLALALVAGVPALLNAQSASEPGSRSNPPRNPTDAEFSFQILDPSAIGLDRALSMIGGLSGDGVTIIGVGVTGTSPEGLVPVRWTQVGGFEQLDLGGFVEAFPFGISDDGEFIVGAGYSEIGAPGVALRWTGSNVPDQLLGFSANPDADRFALAISNNGQVILGDSKAGNGTSRAAVFNLTGNATNAGLVPNFGLWSNFSTCSADGSIRFGNGGNSAGDTVQFRRVGSGAFTVLPPPTGFTDFFISSVNPEGTLGAGNAVDPTDGTPYPVLWSLAGGASTLPIPAGGLGYANDLTPDASRVVGWVIDPVLDVQCVYWENGGAPVDIAQLLKNNGVVIPPSFILYEAHAISHDGTTIIGVGFDEVEFKDQMWLATIPAATACYADCDGSGSLTIDDFICFQTNYALGDLAADCDASGQLNIDDFICFQTGFALGC
jgi:uncharacterized membrane protein